MNAGRNTPRLLWPLQHEVVLAILSMVIVCEILCFQPFFSLLGRTHCWWPQFTADLYKGQSGLVVHDTRLCNNCGDGHPELGEYVGQAWAWGVNETSGLWFDTIRTSGVQTRIYDESPPGPPLPTNTESLVLQTVAANSVYSRINSNRPGQPLRTSIIWSGVALNAISLAMIAALIYGFSTRAQRRIRLNRMAYAKCARCKYDLRGLASTRCPECGHPTWRE